MVEKPMRTAPRDLRRGWLVALILLTAVGAALRLSGLDTKTITHPEIYIPGIPLPAGISEPPPRLDLANLVTWHFYHEPHPAGYYLGMFALTKFFGTSLTALRLPAAVLGTLSIPILYRIGALVYNRTTGLIAAGLLAAHGFHIYWSQTARMYVPECFWGLAATWLLLEMLHASRHRRILEAGYVVAVLAGLSTEWYFWLLVGGHLWIVLHHMTRLPDSGTRLLYIQALAILLGGYTITQAVATRGLAGSGGSPSVAVIRDFVCFGFLLEPDTWSQPERVFPTWFVLGASALALVLLTRGVSARPYLANLEGQAAPAAPTKGALSLAAAGMAFLMMGLALHPGARPMVMAASVFPFVVLTIFPMAGFLRPKVAALLNRCENRPILAGLLSGPAAIMVFSPVFLVAVISVLQPVLVSRALLVFVPYLLLLIGAGAQSFFRYRLVGIPLAILLLGLLTAAILHFRAKPSSPIDYAAIAAAIQERFEQGDLILVRPGRWYLTPLFYYFNDPSVLVGGDYEAAIARRPQPRVWVVHMRETDLGDEIEAALSGFKDIYSVSVKGDRVRLLARVNGA